MKHLGIIIDGNRRWARQYGLPNLEGHRRGYENVKTIGLAAFHRGIEFLSVFAFSTENWRRSQEEVDGLMGLLSHALTHEIDFFLEHDVRLKVVGDTKGLSSSLQQAIQDAEQKTKAGTKGQLNLCINYGGRLEIVEAVKVLMSEGVSSQEVTEERLSQYMWSAGVPDPDLIIRTSGEQRLSGFLTWQSVYSELLFEEKLWPDFTVEDLDRCLETFQARQRRFGQ